MKTIPTIQTTAPSPQPLNKNNTKRDSKEGEEFHLELDNEDDDVDVAPVTKEATKSPSNSIITDDEDDCDEKIQTLHPNSVETNQQSVSSPLQPKSGMFSRISSTFSRVIVSPLSKAVNSIMSSPRLLNTTEIISKNPSSNDSLPIISSPLANDVTRIIRTDETIIIKKLDSNDDTNNDPNMTRDIQNLTFDKSPEKTVHQNAPEITCVSFYKTADTDEKSENVNIKTNLKAPPTGRARIVRPQQTVIENGESKKVDIIQREAGPRITKPAEATNVPPKKVDPKVSKLLEIKKKKFKEAQAILVAKTLAMEAKAQQQQQQQQQNEKEKKVIVSRPVIVSASSTPAAPTEVRNTGNIIKPRFTTEVSAKKTSESIKSVKLPMNDNNKKVESTETAKLKIPSITSSQSVKNIFLCLIFYFFKLNFYIFRSKIIQHRWLAREQYQKLVFY
jgi:hypothetical protein